MAHDLILQLVEEIYEAALIPEEWPSVLTNIAHATGGVGGLFVPLRDRTMTVITSPRLAESNAEYECGWWQHDIRVQEHQRRHLGYGVVSDIDFLDADLMAKNHFYQDFLRPHGLGHTVSLVAPIAPGNISALSVIRGVGEGSFDDEQRRLFAVLGNHAARSLGLMARLRNAARLGQEMAATLDRIACGVAVLDAAAAVTFLNSVAKGLLGKAFEVRRGRLTCALASEQAKLDRLIAGALPGREARLSNSVAVSPIDSGPTVLVQGVPIAPATADRIDRFLLGEGGVLLLIHDVAALATDAARRHLEELGLTAGQARVAELVGRGKSPREAAQDLGIAESTARTVLKQVFARLRLSRQSELAALVTRLAFAV